MAAGKLLPGVGRCGSIRQLQWRKWRQLSTARLHSLQGERDCWHGRRSRRSGDRFGFRWCGVESRVPGMKILWVKAGGLVPPDTGGKIRSYNILRELGRQHSVTFFSFYAAHDGDLHPALKNIFDQAICVPLNLPAPKGAAEMFGYGIRLFCSEP